MKEIIYHFLGLRYVKCHECETLKLLLEEEKRTVKRLLDDLLIKPEPIVEIQKEFIPIKNKLNLAQMKQKLEFDHRIKTETDEKVESLEKELLG